MANNEWEKVKEALKKPATPEAMKEAAEAFAQYQAIQLAKGKGSRPTLVSLGFKKPYPTAIPVDKFPEELERNPAFFEHLRDIVEES